MGTPISIIFAPNGSSRTVTGGSVQKVQEAGANRTFELPGVSDIADTPEKVLRELEIALANGASMLHVHARLVGKAGESYKLAGQTVRTGDAWCDYRFYQEVAKAARALHPDLVLDLSASRTGLKTVWGILGDIALAGGAPFADVMPLTSAADIPHRKVDAGYAEAEPFAQTQSVIGQSVFYLHDVMLRMGIEPSFEIQHERLLRVFEAMIANGMMTKGGCVVQALFGQQQGFPTFDIEEKKRGVYDPTPMERQLDQIIRMCNPKVLGISAGDIKSDKDFVQFMRFVAQYRHETGRQIDTVRVGYEHIGPTDHFAPGNAAQVAKAATIFRDEGRTLRTPKETRQLYDVPARRNTHDLERQRFLQNLREILGEMLPEAARNRY